MTAARDLKNIAKVAGAVGLEENREVDCSIIINRD